MGNTPRYQGFTEPQYNVVLTDDTGAALNLTGCTGGSFTLTMVNEDTGLARSCVGVWTTPADATGKASYQWTSTDMSVVGTWLLYTTVHLPSESAPREFDPDTIVIVPGTVGAGAAPAGVLPAPIASALFFNVRDYGATGNGTTDDYPALQATANAVNAAGGGVLYIPQGTYALSQDVLISSNTWVLGAGRATILKAAAASVTNCLNLSGSSHVVVSDLQINGNKLNVQQLTTQYTKLSGIYMRGADDILITRCYIHDCYVSGVMADGGSTNIEVSNCRMVNNYDNQIYIRAQDTSPYTPCNYITVTGCECSGGSFSGIQILGSSYFSIAGNVCYSNGPTSAQGDGIGSEGASYGTISGNTCYGNGIQGINIRFTGETGGSQSSSHIVVANNVCYNHTSGNGDAGGISISDTDDVVVSANLVYGNAYGINVNGGNGNGVQHCKLIGNQVRGNSSTGIRVIPGAGSTRVMIEDNTVQDNAGDNLVVNGVQAFVRGGTYSGATGTHEGIHLQTGSDNSLIDGCTIYDNTDNGVTIDSPVAGVEIRNCRFDNIVGTNQKRALQEQAGAGPTRMVNNRILNQANNLYVFNNASSRYWDEQTVAAVTVTTSYVMLAQDEVVLCNQSGAIAITLPAATGGVIGKQVVIKDKSGNASTNNITVSGAQTVDGAASKTINSNYGVLRLISDGSNWFSL